MLQKLEKMQSLGTSISFLWKLILVPAKVMIAEFLIYPRRLILDRRIPSYLLVTPNNSTAKLKIPSFHQYEDYSELLFVGEAP